MIYMVVYARNKIMSEKVITASALSLIRTNENGK